MRQTIDQSIDYVEVCEIDGIAQGIENAAFWPYPCNTVPSNVRPLIQSLCCYPVRLRWALRPSHPLPPS